MTSTPPAWKWLDECEVPVQAYQWMTSETPGEAELSFGTPKAPVSATLRIQNDSNPDPTYQDCWPSERYKSDGPDDRDLKDAVRRLYYAAHWTPDRDVDERQLWEDVRDAAGFEPGRAPECNEAAKVTDSVINVESCPECGSVTDLDYPACSRCETTPCSCDPSAYLLAPGYSGSMKVTHFDFDHGSLDENANPAAFVEYPHLAPDTDIDYGPASVLLPKRESGAEEETCIDDNPLLNHMECTFHSCMDTAVAKNEGYAGNADPMANFNDSVRLGVPVPIGVAIRLSDKWARLCRLLQTGENPLADESITDTIMDAVNYLAILLYAIEDEAR